jgi:hypothetical protein
MKTKKLGRPKLAKAEFKSILIGARFAPDESKQVHDAIKRSGKVKSEWVRDILLAASR